MQASAKTPAEVKEELDQQQIRKRMETEDSVTEVLSALQFYGQRRAGQPWSIAREYFRSPMATDMTASQKIASCLTCLRRKMALHLIEEKYIRALIKSPELAEKILDTINTLPVAAYTPPPAIMKIVKDATEALRINVDTAPPAESSAAALSSSSHDTNNSLSVSSNNPVSELSLEKALEWLQNLDIIETSHPDLNTQLKRIGKITATELSKTKIRDHYWEPGYYDYVKLLNLMITGINKNSFTDEEMQTYVRNITGLEDRISKSRLLLKISSLFVLFGLTIAGLTFFILPLYMPSFMLATKVAAEMIAMLSVIFEVVTIVLYNRNTLPAKPLDNIRLFKSTISKESKEQVDESAVPHHYPIIPIPSR